VSGRRCTPRGLSPRQLLRPLPAPTWKPLPATGTCRLTPPPPPPPPCPLRSLDKTRNSSGDLRTAEIRRKMQRIMQSDAAVFRTQASLQEGCTKIDECVASFG
jgi:hypothetical protein